MNEEKIIFSSEFYEEEVQDFAETNYDHELTDIELNRMGSYLWDDDSVYLARIELLAKAIESAMDNKKNQWSYIDKEYLAKKKTNL